MRLALRALDPRSREATLRDASSKSSADMKLRGEVDIVDLDAVTRTFAAIEAELGPVGLLTNNAGAFAAIGPIWQVEPEAWWRDVETNVRGTFNCCRAAIPAMLGRRRG